jgi:hypothetical protein
MHGLGTIRIGEPLRFCKPSDKEQRKNCIHAATHEIMLAIARLGDAEYPWEQRNA